MRTRRAPALPLLLLALAAPAAAQVSSTSGEAYGCAHATYWLDAAPDHAVSVVECGGATCAWVREAAILFTYEQCAPGGAAVEDGALCHDDGARTWRDGAPFAHDRRCATVATTEGGACLVRSSDVQDGRPAVVSRTCVEADGTTACRSETYAWDYGGVFHDRRCVGAEVRDEACPDGPGRAVVLVLGDLTGWLHDMEHRLACVPS